MLRGVAAGSWSVVVADVGLVGVFDLAVDWVRMFDEVVRRDRAGEDGVFRLVRDEDGRGTRDMATWPEHCRT